MSVTRGVANALRKHVRHIPSGTFLRTADLANRFGSRRAVESALSRLANSDEPLVRVRNGVYWRSPISRYGKARPRPAAVARAVCDAGLGPTGWTALHALGLTTQVPSTEELAVIGNPPAGIRGVRFSTRSNLERRRLNYREIAALESLRSVKPSSPDWDRLATTLSDLDREGKIRLALVSRVADAEPARVRNAARLLNATLKNASAA